MQYFTDWPMFWVTVVYVLATIVICWFNWRNVKMVEKQVEESKRQFEESQRLEKIPYFSFEFGDWIDRDERESIFPNMFIHINSDYNSEDTSGGGYSIKVSNIGLGMADCIRCESVTGEVRSEHILPFKLLKCGEEQKATFILSAKKESVEHQYEQLSLVFHYNDLLLNHYTQEVEMEIEVKTGTIIIVHYTTHSPKWMGNGPNDIIQNRSIT